SPTRSTTDQEKSLDFEPQSKSSMNNYNQFKTTVLQPPIESKQFTSEKLWQVCQELGIAQSVGRTVGCVNFC
ncbi:hypothetical protein, partial [Corynebacterium propinquum]|uniref:hypothetical protein n=1 Tax=Corynebacterium propinquum TaxID=43769 RepID=UPI001EE8AB09